MCHDQGMKRPEERGAIGAWAYRARTEADLSPEQVVEQLRERGYAVTAPTIRGIEGGSKRPGGRLLRLLADIYGSQPPGIVPEPTPEADLVAALAEQTRAIMALVEEMRLARERESDAAAAILRAAEALRSLPRPREVAASRGRAAPLGSGG